MAIGLNFLSNCACAAFNWVLRLVARGFLRFISFENILFENKRCVNHFIYTYLTVCFAFEKPGWLLHNTADRAETVFSHLKVKT